MKTMLIALAAAALAGCASNESGARMGFVTATSPVLAVIADDLFTGEAVGEPLGAGTITLQSARDPSVRCVGTFGYSSTGGGNAHVQCNDGKEAKMTFTALSALSGYGYGSTTAGPASFTYGLTPAQALQYLRPPAGKKVITRPEGPALAPI